MTESRGTIARSFSPEASLKRALRGHLKTLGFTKTPEGDLVLPDGGKEVVRNLHRGQRRDKLALAQPFLSRALPNALQHFASGNEIDPARIKLRLVRVKSGTQEADLFRVATLTWSVPVSPGFGRRLRYLVWDDGHNKLAGVIALGDPVFNLSVRDSIIGWSSADRVKRLVGLLDAYVLGAVPPYNVLLGGKAVACLIRSRDVYDDFHQTYGNTVGVISKTAKQAHLVAVTTTSSMGRSAVYNRLKLENTPYFERIGFTEGWGHFHITDALFEKMRDFLRTSDHAYADQHAFGEGPNWRLRTIKAALKALEFKENLLKHGIQREVFITKLASNAFDVLRAGDVSFSDKGKKIAGNFGAELSGADASSFTLVTGKFNLRPAESIGGPADLAALNAVNMEKFYGETDAERSEAIAPFLSYRKTTTGDGHGPDLYHALKSYGPFARLVNETMQAALSFDEVREKVFPGSGVTDGNRGVDALIALGSRARLDPNDASLLPCRVHAFYRGLPGLWACMDPNCSELAPAERGGPIGRLYNQPRERCACTAPVLEYFTCRYCGTSYARAYVKDVTRPDQLFAEPGHMLVTADGTVEEFQKLDLLLEAPPDHTRGRPIFYDLASGLLDPGKPGTRCRTIYINPAVGTLSGATGTTPDEDEGEDDDGNGQVAGLGQFVPCGCCGKSIRGKKSSVQDHVTKGDQPFQALVSAQIRVQPPSPKPPSEFAPLRGRKVLVFSDSRQVAARLAPALQLFSLKDTLRALLPVGYQMLVQSPDIGASIVLDQAWVAVVVAAHRFGVRIRPETDSSETMPRLLDTPPGQMPRAGDLLALQNEKPPANLTRAIVDVLRDNILGLEALAVASLVEAPSLTAKLKALPALKGLAETDDDKIAVVRAWIRAWSRKNGIWFRDMPPSFWGTGNLVRAHKGEFKAMQAVLRTPALKREFGKTWLPIILKELTEGIDGSHRLVARKLSLEIGGIWRRCAHCTSVHRPISTVEVCIDCGSTSIHAFDPNNDKVFRARKAFYRNPVIAALTEDAPSLMSLIAAEHTAQLNASRPDEAFSQAEKHEMRFQDIDLAWRETDLADTSIDVLSSTTTMEVGIDIGELSGVALRNMPPGRANYQQRSGRAGRRGNAVATVVAFGSADSHDDHYFSSPQEMIRGQMVDPRLTLENPDIACRHIRAYLLQRYHEDRLPDLADAPEGAANLFSVLGTVGDFRDGAGHLNRADLSTWLAEHKADLTTAIDRWLPFQLSEADRAKLLAEFAGDLLAAIDMAVSGPAKTDPLGGASDTGETAAAVPWENAVEATATEGTEEETLTEQDPQSGADAVVDAAADNLLDRLLYWGVLPRYAFPTDVAPFYVFSPSSTGFRAQMEFAPSQGLNVALSQYAPNKQIWIKGKQYTSKAIYSPFKHDRRNAWGKRKLYLECSRCGHAKTEEEFDVAKLGQIRTCEACNTPGTFGPAKPWFRPPGFAHPWAQAAVSTPDEPNETAYATRAKLVMPSGGPDMGDAVNSRLRALPTRQHLLVSNSGPGGDGYEYCVRCGRIESVSAPEILLRQPHPVPYPNNGEALCPGYVSRGVVLGTDFPTDIALFALRLGAPFRLLPAESATLSAMRTVCEALAKAACRLLQIESGEVLAEYRPALNAEGAEGVLVEVFLYDTLAGGAGFAPQLASRGEELFKVALGLLEHCPGNCDASCYRCLRGFRNRLDHALLDRRVGAQLLGHILTGNAPEFSLERAAQTLKVLSNDLERQLSDRFEILRDFVKSPAAKAPLILRSKADGKETLIDLCSPIAPDVPIFGTTAATAKLISDLMVRKHLGEAIDRITEGI